MRDCSRSQTPHLETTSARLVRLGIVSLIALTMVLVATGCESNPSLSIAAEPGTIPAGGDYFTEITVRATKGGKAIPGAEIEIVTDKGSFLADQEFQSIIIAANADGRVSLELYSALEEGLATVTATYVYGDGKRATATTYVAFSQAQAGNLPVADTLYLQCIAQNLGALRDPQPPLMLPCWMNAQTIAGEYVELSEMDPIFMTETGTMGLEVGDDPLGEMRNLVFRVWGSDLPLDVLPDPDEPWYSGPGGEDRNPRDGLVSVVGITLGSEAWEDLNGNGQWDTGEPHTDLPEPLLDVDDDGVFTPGVDRFYDSNGDGEYTGPNNQYDARTYIWIAYKLLLTGPPDFSVSNVTTFPEDGAIPNGEHGELLVLLLDQNLNPIAGFSDRQDHLAFSGIIPPSLFVPYEEMPLFTNIGMDFDAQGRVEHFWTEHQLGHTMHIRDDYPETVEATPIPWSLTISVHTTPGPLECSDHTFCPIWVDQETYEFADPVVGTVQ